MLCRLLPALLLVLTKIFATSVFYTDSSWLILRSDQRSLSDSKRGGASVHLQLSLSLCSDLSPSVQVGCSAREQPATLELQGTALSVATALQLVMGAPQCGHMQGPVSMAHSSTQVLRWLARGPQVLRVWLPCMCQLPFTGVSSGCSQTDALTPRKAFFFPR